MSVTGTMNAKRFTDEIRHAHDDLEYFYLEAKRNKKLAKWAAKKLGVDTKEYFMDLLECDLSSAGPKPVVDRIKKDFKKAGLKIKSDKIWDKLHEFEQEAFRKLLDAQADKLEKQCMSLLKTKTKKKKK